MKLFDTAKKESFRTRMLRLMYNTWPCLWCTGGRVRFFAADYTEMHVSLRLSLLTYNRVGTIYGGSMYSSIDPHYMLMFMQILGKEYVVWDKAATIRFVRPAKTRIKCLLKLGDELIANVKQQASQEGEYSFDLPLQYEDENGTVYAAFTKTIYVATRQFYQQKLEAKRNKP